MFWDKWIPARLLIKPVVCGIEAVAGENGTTWFYTILKKQGNKLEIAEQGSCMELRELPTQISKNKIPVALCINGRGIILRKIPVAEGEDITSEEFLQQRLPGIQLTDFNIQLFRQENNTVFAAIVRKEQMDDLVKELSAVVPEVVEIIIGAPAILSMSGLLSNHNFVLPNGARVELLNGVVEQIQPVNHEGERAEVEVDALHIPATQLLSFAAAFAYLTGQQIWASPNEELLQVKQKHSDKNKFRLVYTIFIALGFGLCLINFLFFSTYFSQTTKLDTELGLYQDKYDKINELLTNYEKKKSLIEETGLLENYFFSTYTDKIAATIPKDVILTEYIFNPQTETDVAEDSLMNFNKRLIMIKGNCNKSLLINEWVNVLKTQNFIKDVNLEKFLFNNDGNQPNFEIKIVVTD